ncbi:bifunctional phosphopantothenoylcysteine decarboxylase/phosphopantothenate--cysteine ligase CoaBC [Legionella jordanis]|uniref:Coenzyme A biosynthesis bifunctional protein CoaBC n=1 Tax=Legionella jordanis TaxID=456 RepID=A0A0W0VBC8_9GAMM|nr:bifunctional phosphopantothenoylcysteine decarboxylase/phosphopantothenate--cysteine ligase CoaBC [Legionella jordanis]KTD17415.1 bifunctional phosphopantothenoylcysteine decarboxylase/phosphopantothenate synthase [Legionella jordanis]RMX01820.1 bifunctional phosphopantothenoylcysteine decarboxylase/phosphopantothenate--cysteine ligase CoaBC [Legionella jordanis]RMX15484.1 bifunctional phosphopantothenoylcysteine decarboxylase/phosphopantothenate--cysteine ligase CoaBC [Legionella jordanis]V
MQDFAKKKILLAVCGGIAAYKAAYLVRELCKLGAEIRVVMTASAQKFITPLTLQALSGHEVAIDLFNGEAERGMGHIELARWADYFLIAPASANTIAKMAYGLADDLLSTIHLVATCPIVLCPAMNRSMWQHPSTQSNCQLLAQRGVLIVGPEEGSQACGEEGFGRLSEANSIINALRLFDIHQRLKGQKILITAGPTREAIDPVRYLSNHSSGKMGYALAEAAKHAGAEVTLISGPTALTPPSGVDVHYVESAQQMLQQVMLKLEKGMIFIGTAAVADYGILSPANEKIKKKNHRDLELSLTLNPDILSEVVASGKAAYVLGFAAETTDVIKHAQEKLIKKKLDMVVANQVGPKMAFGQDDNQVTILTRDNQVELPLDHKIRVAGRIIAILASNIHNGKHAQNEK